MTCVCQRYGEKPWTQDEWRAIQSFERSLRGSNEARLRFLPLRFGDGEVDGLFDTAIVPDVRSRPPIEVADLIIKRWRTARSWVDLIPPATRSASRDLGSVLVQRRHPEQPRSRRHIWWSAVVALLAWIVGRLSELPISIAVGTALVVIGGSVIIVAQGTADEERKPFNSVTLPAVPPEVRPTSPQPPSSASRTERDSWARPPVEATPTRRVEPERHAPFDSERQAPIVVPPNRPGPPFTRPRETAPLTPSWLDAEVQRLELTIETGEPTLSERSHVLCMVTNAPSEGANMSTVTTAVSNVQWPARSWRTFQVQTPPNTRTRDLLYLDIQVSTGSAIDLWEVQTLVVMAVLRGPSLESRLFLKQADGTPLFRVQGAGVYRLPLQAGANQGSPCPPSRPADIAFMEIFESGWPGSRVYNRSIGIGQPIACLTPVEITWRQGEGERTFNANVVDNFVQLGVGMHEGDTFSPNQHKIKVEFWVWY